MKSNYQAQKVAATKAAKVEGEIVIEPLRQGRMTACLLGTSPLFFHRVSEKASRELLLPALKKNQSDKASSLKHDPLAEFRASPYMFDDPAAKTLLGFPALGIKAALRSAALDVPGAKKAQIGRLVLVEPTLVGIYGVPQISTVIARNKGSMGAGTPDPRTRAVIVEWAAFFEFQYAMPLLNETSVYNLITAAGARIGIGDWRQEKGSGSYGCFEPVSPDDADFVRIVKTGGREVQEAAMAKPQALDKETEDLLKWFDVEVRRRGMKVAA